MALRKLKRINYAEKWPVSIKYHSLHSFKEVLIFLYQSILEMRRMTHLHGSAHFTIPLRYFKPSHVTEICYFKQIQSMLRSK